MWNPGLTLEELEKQAIEKAFRFYQGNKTHTANALGISIRTLDAKLEKYEHDREELQKRTDVEERARKERLEAERRISDKPIAQAPEEHVVSLPVGKEVQGVPPGPARKGNQRRPSSGVRGGTKAAASHDSV